MSWIFGGGSKPPQGSNNAPQQQNAQNQGQGAKSSKTTIPTDSGYSFDSEALERAAKAAKELEHSKYAKEAFELTKQQEVTNQLSNQANIKQYELQIEQMKGEQIRVQEDERRKTLLEEARMKKAREEYQDQLARQRHQDQLATKARAEEDSLRRQEESIQRQEALRRQTVEYEQDLRYKNDMKLLEARLRGEAQVERENRDVRLEQVKAKAVEDRATWQESLRTSGDLVAKAYHALFADWTRTVRTVAQVGLLAGSIYGVKYGLGVGFRAAEARIGKPSLVRQTSRLNAVDLVKSPVLTARRFVSKPSDALKGIILKPELEARLREVAIATRHTKKNNGYYRNLLMCGPPGTGKTMFVKSLALHSGMDYAIMTGGDVAPMGKEGVTAVHKVFDWASTSRRGVLLFVDEADAFLRKRSQERISEDMRATLNAFLYRTGEQSQKFMLVLASNQPEQLDWAINDRVDEIVEFDLPDLAERERLVAHYYEKYVLQPSIDKRNKITVDPSIDHTAKCREIAAKTAGLSGREISKIAVAWQAAAYASETGVIDANLLDEKVALSVAAHAKKVQWAMHTLPLESAPDATAGSKRDYLSPSVPTS
ncbi:hypothetical protein BOX15_Mlig006034g1 [Macrostomum lignano]|uniref:AAA+ ATPase domain-containing protein n=1 Tax=Macrostomum lignano TaxID=282301 RepID=A0A267EZ43_9PLAT|nr:hypothetical protein BOX15_Mlig006034g1 [Macrostomum lignano]